MTSCCARARRSVSPPRGANWRSCAPGARSCVGLSHLRAWRPFVVPRAHLEFIVEVGEPCCSAVSRNWHLKRGRGRRCRGPRYTCLCGTGSGRARAGVKRAILVDVASATGNGSGSRLSRNEGRQEGRKDRGEGRRDRTRCLRWVSGAGCVWVGCAWTGCQPRPPNTAKC